MTILERHVSPDGLLVFVAAPGADGKVSFGFDGYPWQGQLDPIATASGVASETEMRRVISDLLGNRMVIVVSRVDGVIRDIRIADDPQFELYCQSDDEVLELRTWDGRPWERNWGPK